jgi:hypothetical protein
MQDRITSDVTASSPTPVALGARLLGAMLVIATGAIHLYLYNDYFSSVPTIGHLFVANFVAGVVIGLLILLHGGRLLPLIGAAFCAGTLGAFLWSVEWGLFGYQERLNGTWQVRAAVVEIAGVIVGLAAAALARRSERPQSALRTTSV